MINLSILNIHISPIYGSKKTKFTELPWFPWYLIWNDILKWINIIILIKITFLLLNNISRLLVQQLILYQI